MFSGTSAIMNVPILKINKKKLINKREFEIVTSAKATHNLQRMNVWCLHCNILHWFDENLAWLPRELPLF